MQDLKDYIQLLHNQQKENNVVRMCFTNCKMLYDFAKIHLNIEIDFVCGYIVKYLTPNLYGITEHCWCEYKGLHLEPSYEIDITRNVQYVKTFKELAPYIRGYDTADKREFIKTRADFQKKFNRQINDDVLFFCMHKVQTQRYILRHKPEWVVGF